MNYTGSFTAYIFIKGPYYPCKLGFEYYKFGGQPKTVAYLCASTMEASSPILFHFKHQGDGKYLVTSRSSLYLNSYLGITNNSYISPYSSSSDANLFSFKKDGKNMTLDDMSSDVVSDLEMVCRDGGIELHNYKEYLFDQNQWTAYVCTQNGDRGLVGSKIELQIVRRNVGEILDEILDIKADSIFESIGIGNGIVIQELKDNDVVFHEGTLLEYNAGRKIVKIRTYSGDQIDINMEHILSASRINETT